MARAPKVRQKAKRDANHNEIVDTFESLGASWQDLSGVGGALDGWLGVSLIDQRVEIKDGSRVDSERRLTEDEERVFQEWRGRPPVVVESVEDAIKLVHTLRREAIEKARNDPT